jgi:hypothetical protein
MQDFYFTTVSMYRISQQPSADNRQKDIWQVNAQIIWRRQDGQQLLIVTMTYNTKEHIRTWAKTNKTEADDMPSGLREHRVWQRNMCSVNVTDLTRGGVGRIARFMSLLNLHQSSVKPIDDRFHNMAKLVWAMAHLLLRYFYNLSYCCLPPGVRRTNAFHPTATRHKAQGTIAIHSTANDAIQCL